MMSSFSDASSHCSAAAKSSPNLGSRPTSPFSFMSMIAAAYESKMRESICA